MEKTKTVEIMTRIKQHYQEFIIDDYKIEEWHSELVKYDFEDVNKKLDEHLRSENFGNQIPKLYFLTKYLIPSIEKGTIKEKFIRCRFCERPVNLLKYDEHYDKCSSVDYMIRNFKKYRNQTVTREQLEDLSEEKFQKIYYSLLKDIDGNKNMPPMEQRALSVFLAIHDGDNNHSLSEIMKA